jgi:hypothetical protein
LTAVENNMPDLILQLAGKENECLPQNRRLKKKKKEQKVFLRRGIEEIQPVWTATEINCFLTWLNVNCISFFS